MEAPLAERIRPQKLSDYISQLHLVGPNGSLTQQIEKGIIPSLILWGPPGTGKTTLAQIISQESKRPFYELSAINSGVAAIREVIEKAKQSGGLFTTKNPILFIDEIHMIMGAGSGGGGSADMANLIKPSLNNGKIRCIGSTTQGNTVQIQTI